MAEPVAKGFGPRHRPYSPSAVQSQLPPRVGRTDPGLIDARARQFIQTRKHCCVAGDPVRHHDQTGELQLKRTARHPRGFRLGHIAVAKLFGEYSEQ